MLNKLVKCLLHINLKYAKYQNFCTHNIFKKVKLKKNIKLKKNTK